MVGYVYMSQPANAKIIALPDKHTKVEKIRNMLRTLYSKSLQVASPTMTRTAFIVMTRMAGTARSSHPKLVLRQQAHTAIFPTLNSVSDKARVGIICTAFLDLVQLYMQRCNNRVSANNANSSQQQRNKIEQLRKSCHSPKSMARSCSTLGDRDVSRLYHSPTPAIPGIKNTRLSRTKSV